MAKVYRLHWRASAGTYDSGIPCEWDTAAVSYFFSPAFQKPPSSEKVLLACCT